MIEWIGTNSNVQGVIIRGPYFFVTLDSLCDFTISFNNKKDEWVLECEDVFSILFLNVLPSNFDDFKSIVFCLADNPRDIFSYLMNSSIQRYKAWSNPKTLSHISPKATIHSSTAVYSNVYISEGVEIGSNCSIGHPGFGFGRINGEAFRLIHSGGVIIDENVNIGTNSTVVSGTFKPTFIGRDVLIDDHVHVAHNCSIGEESTLTAGAVLSGSVNIKAQGWLGPNSSVLNGVKLGGQTFVGIGAVVTKSFDGGIVAGNPAKKLRG
jgi:UDP-3-O-[3-hydroxymyristoyl] glucosamine N-acyltransferase